VERSPLSRIKDHVDLVGLLLLLRLLRPDGLLNTDLSLNFQSLNTLIAQETLEIKDAMEVGISGLGTTLNHSEVSTLNHNTNTLLMINNALPTQVTKMPQSLLILKFQPLQPLFKPLLIKDQLPLLLMLQTGAHTTQVFSATAEPQSTTPLSLLVIPMITGSSETHGVKDGV